MRKSYKPNLQVPLRPHRLADPIDLILKHSRAPRRLARPVHYGSCKTHANAPTPPRIAGRAADGDVVLADAGVAPRHVAVRVRAQAILLRALRGGAGFDDATAAMNEALQ